MSRPLADVLEHVLAGEPELDGEIEAVFRRAALLRRRRRTVLITGGTATLTVLAVAGYLLTAAPARRPVVTTVVAPVVAVPTPTATTAPDRVRAAIRTVTDAADLLVVPLPPERGFGWRQYSILGADGTDHGTLEVAVFASDPDFCFPPRNRHKSGCGQPSHAAGGIDYIRYDDAANQDWPVNETIARRASDGRVIAVMATAQPLVSPSASVSASASPKASKSPKSSKSPEHGVAEAPGMVPVAFHSASPSPSPSPSPSRSVSKSPSASPSVSPTPSASPSGSPSPSPSSSPWNPDDPALTAAQVQKLATDKHLIDAFGPEESCTDSPAADACPVLEIQIPTGN